MTIDIRKRYGESIVLENCIVGVNLNLVSIRGYARIDILAAISAPDIFDQIHNEHGTQRDLSPKRSREALQYALEAVELSPSTNPRAFTEVILNVRDNSVVHIIDLDGDGEIDFSSTSQIEELGVRRAEVRINLQQMTLPPPEYDPQISRVDGNHRLSMVLEMDQELLDDVDSLPTIAFCLFVGLDPDQERAIFRDINSKQAKMETAHLDQIALRLEGEDLLSGDNPKKDWALWIAKQLTGTGMPFEGLVFFGGSKRGVKSAGLKPILKINALRDTVRYSIDDVVERQFFIIDPTRAALMTIEEREKERKSDAQLFTLLLERYWSAVRKAFPEAWQDKREFILFQSIGQMAFGSLAARVIAIAIVEGKFEQSYFDAVMATIAKKIDLSHANPAWEGVAGAVGGKKVLKALEAAINLPGANIKQLKDTLLPEKSKLEETD